MSKRLSGEIKNILVYKKKESVYLANLYKNILSNLINLSILTHSTDVSKTEDIFTLFCTIRTYIYTYIYTCYVLFQSSHQLSFGFSRSPPLH